MVVQDSDDSIIFLGTAGARFVVIRQLLASGGAWLKFGDVELLLDPGPGCLVHSAKKKLDATHLKGIILSHKHIDHSGDVNIMLEAMTEGGFERRGVLFAPADAFDNGAVVFPYALDYPEKVEVLREGGQYTVGDVFFQTPVRHRHPVETYGFIFRTPRHTVAWITDTKYFDGLADYYRGELLVMNVVMLEPRDGVDHLAISEARRIIQEARPRVAILTHFGMSIWRSKPWEIAQTLAQDTGIKVIAARDGMRFGLSEL